MLIIGLTGGIGTGKSTAAEYFIEKGFALIDADYIGHQITADGMPLVDTLNEMFGPGTEYNKDNIPILSEPGKLDRKAMAHVAFTDEAANEKFDELMFSAIIEETQHSGNEIGTFLVCPRRQIALKDAPQFPEPHSFVRNRKNGRTFLRSKIVIGVAQFCWARIWNLFLEDFRHSYLPLKVHAERRAEKTNRSFQFPSFRF